MDMNYFKEELERAIRVLGLEKIVENCRMIQI